MRTIEKLKDIQKLLDEKSIKAEFVIISLDPAHDTPDQLIKYKKKIGIDLKNWHFLRGSEEETEKLRTLSGITSWKYYDHIIHDFRVFILDKGGNIQHDIRNWNADLKTIF